MIGDLEAANEIMGESAELLGRSRRNELIDEMEMTDDAGGGGRGPRL